MTVLVTLLHDNCPLRFSDIVHVSYFENCLCLCSSSSNPDLVYEVSDAFPLHYVRDVMIYEEK